MELPRAGREYWAPPLSNTPTGAVATQASFDGGATWVDLEDVEGALSVLVAGPDVTELPHPAGTVELPNATTNTMGRTFVKVKLVGPGSVEILIRDAEVIDLK